MSITSQADILVRGLWIADLMRVRPRRVAELVDATGLEQRTVERLLGDLRKVGPDLTKRGLAGWEVITDIRGRERYHRIVDHPVEKTTPKRDSRH